MAGTPIDELINNLYEMVEDAWAMPLGNDRCVLEREKVLDILDEVRANLPSDLKMAREIVEKRNDIIAAGKKEYDNLNPLHEHCLLSWNFLPQIKNVGAYWQGCHCPAYVSLRYRRYSQVSCDFR